jgi:hypothetical protein
VLGYEWARTARNNVHAILDDPRPVITLRPAGLRKGTLKLFFRTKQAALDAEAAHALADVFTILDPAHTDLSMRYVVVNDIHVTQDTGTMRPWIVEVPFQEVA